MALDRCVVKDAVYNFAVLFTYLCGDWFTVQIQRNRDWEREMDWHRQRVGETARSIRQCKNSRWNANTPTNWGTRLIFRNGEKKRELEKETEKNKGAAQSQINQLTSNRQWSRLDLSQPNSCFEVRRVKQLVGLQIFLRTKWEEITVWVVRSSVINLIRLS